MLGEEGGWEYSWRDLERHYDGAGIELVGSSLRWDGI